MDKPGAGHLDETPENPQQEPGTTGGASEGAPASVSPLFISDGKLFQKREENTVVHIESQYVLNMKEREERNKQLAGWKEGTTWDSNFAQMRGMGERAGDSEIQFSSVTRLNERELLYFLKGTGFGGLFNYNLDTGTELRLLHSQNIDYQDFSEPNAKGDILLASFQAGFNSHIAMLGSDGNNFQEITSGDTLDTAPAWVPGEEEQVVYQSQGLARDQDGFIKGVGPAALNLLSVKTGELKTIFSEEKFDFLKPLVSTTGDLFFIRRPYEASHYTNTNAFLDVLKFPFRLLRAVFHYLNFFSIMYSRKPLTSAGGPQVKEDIKSIVIKGRRIQAEKELRSGQHVHGVPSLVPNTWVLFRCDQQGKQHVVATNVSSYSLAGDGEIIYTNGCGVFCINKYGRSRKLHQEKLIEEVFA